MGFYFALGYTPLTPIAWKQQLVALVVQLGVEIIVDLICLQVEDIIDQLPMRKEWEVRSTREFMLALVFSGTFVFSNMFIIVFKRKVPESCIDLPSICSCGCETTYVMQTAVCAPIIDSLVQENATLLLPPTFNSSSPVDMAAAVEYALLLTYNATAQRCISTQNFTLMLGT